MDNDELNKTTDNDRSNIKNKPYTAAESLLRKLGLRYRKSDYNYRGPLAAKFKKISEEARKRKQLVIELPNDLLKRQKLEPVLHDNAIFAKKSPTPNVANHTNGFAIVTKLEECDSFPSTENTESSVELQNSQNNEEDFNVSENHNETDNIGESVISKKSNAFPSVENVLSSSELKSFANATDNSKTLLETKEKVDKTFSSSMLYVSKADTNMSISDKNGFTPSKQNVYDCTKIAKVQSMSSLQESTRNALEFLKNMGWNKSHVNPCSKWLHASDLNKRLTKSTPRIGNKHGLHLPSMMFQTSYSRTNALSSVDTISKRIALWKHNLMLST